MTELRLSLSWEAYQKNICNGLGLLQQRGEFVDMTIAADGHHVKVHQMIMSLVSPFIKELITSAQCPHPVIFLNRVSYETLQLILEYAYTGEVLVTRDKLDEFLEACRALSIKGLESETIKSTADGGIMRLVDATDSSEPVQHTKMSFKEQPIKTGAKRIRTESLEDNINENEHVIEDLHMDDSNFEEDYLDDTIVPEIQPDDSQGGDKTNPALSSTIQYSLSCQGSIQVVLNRFLYRLRHTRKNNERMWRCQDYNKKQCPAFLITKGDVVRQRGCAHNHLFHDKQILKRVRNGNMFTSYKTVENMASLAVMKKQLSTT